MNPDPSNPAPWPSRRLALSAAAAGLAGALSAPLPGDAQSGAPIRVRIVGGLANINQYRLHEEPFWTREIPKLTGGRMAAEIVPFDQAGLRGQEMLRLIQLGAVPFGTALLTLVNAQDAELGAVDLPGLNPDMTTLRRNLAAFRPHLERRLRERWGIEALAVYVYPAQVTFCAKPFAGLADLRGRRIRSSSAAQSDFVEALGAVPVQTPFAAIVSSMRSGAIECAITGTMSGNTIGLHEVTTHVHTMAVNWGLSVFGANAGAWQALPEDLRTVIRRGLVRLEQEIWDEADRETGEGITCNAGGEGCRGGSKGRMTVVRESAADAALRRQLFVSTVLPRWIERGGPQCAAVWNGTIARVSGISAVLPGR